MENIIRGRIDDRSVYIDGRELPTHRSRCVFNHSCEFSWGFGGSGPAQLALAILLEFTSGGTALRLHQAFKWEVVAPLPKADFELKIDVRRWIAEALGVRKAEELLVIEPVIGYRVWAANMGTRRLRSAVADYIWSPGINVAQCRPFAMRPGLPWPHPAPEFNCTCGFYSFKSLRVMERLVGSRVRGFSYANVFGEVELMGKVVEHEYGYRAEKVKIRTLVASPAHGMHDGLYIIREVADYYKVPLISHDEYIEKEVLNDKYRRAEKDFEGRAY